MSAAAREQAKKEREAAAKEEAEKEAIRAELAKMKELEDRIKAPSIWGRNTCGIRYEDLQDRRYEEAVKFLKKHYLSEEITWRSLKIMEDKEGTDEFIHNARIWLKDKMSIAVVKEGKDKLVGLMIMRIQDKNAYSRTFSKVKLTYNPLYTSVMTFYNKIEKPVDVYEIMNCKKYLKIYVMAVKNRYRHRGITKELLKAAQGLAASAFVPCMVGFFLTGRAQQIATELGFQKFNELYYIRYLVDDEIVFWDIGTGNYGAAFMGLRIPDIEELEEIHGVTSSRFNVQPEDVAGEGEEEEDGKEEKHEDEKKKEEKEKKEEEN